ncbi:MAG TPA: ATP-binding protein [Streptosporangiaceae bacterium]|nr:ATP-binding protein [Streptosporangiaceae bacterium]
MSADPPGAAASATRWPWLALAAEMAAARTGTAQPEPAGSGRPGAGCRPRVAVRTAGRDLASVAVIRCFTRSTLQRWDAARRSDDITLVVSELLTNALRHTLPKPGRPVRVGLLQPLPGAGVLCAVADPGLAVPQLPPPSRDGESGRGLRVVGELSDQWGCTTPDRGGKVVWAMFAAPGQVLPQRVPGREWPGRASRVTVTDRRLLARVLHGLENL